MISPLAKRASGGREGQQVPEDGVEHHTTGAGTLPATAQPSGIWARQGHSWSSGPGGSADQEANSQRMRNQGQTGNVVPVADSTAKHSCASPAWLRRGGECPWLSLNGLLAHGNGWSTDWGYSGWLRLIRALSETFSNWLWTTFCGEFKACSTVGIKPALFCKYSSPLHDSVGIPTSRRLTEEVRKVLGKEDLDNTGGVCVWERQGDRRLHQAKTLKPAPILNLWLEGTVSTSQSWEASQGDHLSHSQTSFCLFLHLRIVFKARRKLLLFSCSCKLAQKAGFDRFLCLKEELHLHLFILYKQTNKICD